MQIKADCPQKLEAGSAKERGEYRALSVVQGPGLGAATAVSQAQTSHFLQPTKTLTAACAVKKVVKTALVPSS